MSTAVAESATTTPKELLVPRNDVNLLRGVSWEEYCAYRNDPENNSIRMYYSDGVLLLMSTESIHERIKMLFDRILSDWSVRNDVNTKCFGEWTMQRPSLLKGLEADNCYYVSSLGAIQDTDELDLERAPPPDIAIEIDLTTHSDRKFTIYAALGVSEVWIWQGAEFVVYRLTQDGKYVVGPSVELPAFPLQAATDAIVKTSRTGDLDVIRAFRADDPSFSE